MLALMYQGIENGTIETKEQKREEQRKNLEGLIGIFGAKKKKEG